MRLPDGRISVEPEGDLNLEIRIRPERDWFLIVFLTAFAAGWAVGALAVLSWLVALPALFLACRGEVLPRDGCARFFEEVWKHRLELVVILLGWLPLWLLLGRSVLKAWAYQLRGREAVVVGSMYLTIRRSLFRRVREETYEIGRMRDMRYSPEPLPLRDRSFGGSWRMLERLLGYDAGSVAFAYNGETHRFGVGLNEEEARTVIRAIVGRSGIAT